MSKDRGFSGKAREMLFSRVASMLESDGSTASAEEGAPGGGGKATDFSTLPGYAELRVQRAIGERLGLRSPYFRLHEGRLEPRSRVEGRDVLNFSGYDYLGLNGHPEVMAAAQEALDRYGISASGSRHVAGERPVHRSLERALAHHYQADDALLFVSGHATNVGVIGQLLGPKDLVVCDAGIHNSALGGAQLSGAARRSFVHNDLDNLEEVLSRSRKKHQRALIVVEGLYSMDGDVPDLPRLVEIKEKFDAWLMVDEAHALGVMGRRGLGSFEHFGVDPRRVDIWMGTLSKTLAGCGGYVAGNAVLVDYLRLTVGSFVFSVAMPPLIAAGCEKALEVLHREPERVARLQANGAHFLAYARRKGLDTGSGRGLAVAPVMVGDSIASVALSQLLLERDVNVLPVFYPGVPMKSARLRFFLTAMHETAEIETAIDRAVDALSVLPQRLPVAEG